METTLLIVLGVLCGVLGVGCGVLWWDRGRVKREAAGARGELEAERARAAGLDGQVRSLELEKAKLGEEVRGFSARLEEQKKTLDEALAKSKEASESVFKALAGMC
jgi:uncharacterized protein YlxW (UPF0749 family)